MIYYPFLVIVKGGETQILKILKRREPEKIFWDKGNQKEGGKIFKNKGGATF